MTMDDVGQFPGRLGRGGFGDDGCRTNGGSHGGRGHGRVQRRSRNAEGIERALNGPQMVKRKMHVARGGGNGPMALTGFG